MPLITPTAAYVIVCCFISEKNTELFLFSLILDKGASRIGKVLAYGPRRDKTCLRGFCQSEI